MRNIKDLNYFKNNGEEDYLHTPISVLRYISELEKALGNSNKGKESHVIKCIKDELIDAKDGDEIKLIVQNNKVEIWNNTKYTGRHLFRK